MPLCIATSFVLGMQQHISMVHLGTNVFVSDVIVKPCSPREEK